MMKNEPIHIRQILVRVGSNQVVVPLTQLQKEMEQKATAVIHQILQNVLKSSEFDE